RPPPAGALGPSDLWLRGTRPFPGSGCLGCLPGARSGSPSWGSLPGPNRIRGLALGTILVGMGRPGTARLLALVTAAGALLATALTVLAHIAAAPGMDARSLTISDYAVSERGRPVAMAMFVL